MASQRSSLTMYKSAAAGVRAAGTGPAGRQTLAESGTASSPSITTSFFTDPTLNFQTLFALGVAGYGVSELGEVLSAVDRIRDVGSSYQAFFDQIETLADEGQKQKVNRLWSEVLAGASPATRFTIAKRSEVFAQPTFYDQVLYMERFSLTPAVIGRIRAPTLVMEAEQEQFFPGQSLAVYRQLRTRKRLHRFTTSEGAEYHDEPMAPQARNEVLFGWLDEALRI